MSIPREVRDVDLDDSQAWPDVDPWDDNPASSADPVSTGADRLDRWEIDQEVRRLRIRDEARRTYAAEKIGPGEPFDAGTLTEILARPPAPRMRLDGLMPWESAVLLVAQRKAGRTTLGGNLARSLLTGEPFLDRFEVQPLAGDLAVLNYEVAGAQLAHWFHDIGVPGDRCHLVNLRGRRNPLSTAEDREQLAALLRSRGVEAVFVDPFGRAYGGASQNDAGEVGGWLVDLDRFVRAEVGARDLILTAHAGWNGERTRGSSALEDWADTVWTMTRDAEADDDTGHRYFRAEGRDVELSEDRLSFDPDTRRLSLSGAGGRRAGRQQRKLDELAEAALEVVAGAPGMNGSQVDEALKKAGHSYQKGKAARALQQLVNEGRLTVTPGSRNQKHYELPRATPTYPEGRSTNYPNPPIGVGVVEGVVGESELPRCLACSDPLDLALVTEGAQTHPGCEAQS